MVITTTGVAFTLSSLGLAFCGWRFFRAFQKIGESHASNRIGVLLSTYYFGTAFQHAILGVGSLFFGGNSRALYTVLVTNQFVLIPLTALAVYLGFYILLPNFSPWPGVVVISLFGTLIASLTVFSNPQPFVTAGRSIDWDLSPRLEILLYYLLLFQIGLPFLIFAKNFFLVKTRGVKNVSLVIMAIQFLGIVNISILFSNLFNEVIADRARIFDAILSIIGIVCLVAFLLIPIIAGWSSRASRQRSPYET